MYWKYALLFLALVLHTVSSGCSAREQLERIEIVEQNEVISPTEANLGGTINLFSTRPDTLNPIQSFNSYVKYYSPILYDGLYRLDSDQIPQNWLAIKENVSQNGLVWTINLREDVLWHNGFRLTTDDIEYTFKNILDPSTENIYKNNLQNVVGFSLIDPLTFQVTLAEKDVFFPWKLTFPILSSSYYRLEGGEDKGIPPVGTGPFMFSHFDGEVRMVLKRYESWWGGLTSQESLKKPYLEEVNIIFHTDSSQMPIAFQNGNIDLAILEKESFSPFRNRKDVGFKSYSSNEFEFLALNLNSPSPISQREVRRSISEAIDRNLIINSALGGAGVPSNLPISPESFYYKSFLWTYTPSKDKAHSILFDNNWRLENGLYTKIKDGISQSIEFTLLINSGNLKRMSVAQIIKDQLRDIGMDVTILALDNQNYYDALLNGKYDVALAGVTLPFHPELKRLYSSREMVINVAGYSEVLTDNLLAIYYSINDLREQVDILEKINFQIKEDVPYLGLYFYENALVYQRNLRGNFSPRAWDEINDITSWFFKLDEEMGGT